MDEVPELHVHTFRQGLLSAVGHDLSLCFERFEARLEANRLTVEVELASLRVEGALSHGRVSPDTPSDKDRREIEQSARERVLHTAQHPSARFEAEVTATAGGFQARGDLSLNGKRRPWTVAGTVQGSVLVAEATLVPSQWGIAPFRALAGTLKVQDRVQILARLPLEGPPPQLDDAALGWTRPG